MNLLTFQTSTSTVVFAKDFWIFIAIAVPLTLLTLGIWFFATRLEKKNKRNAIKNEGRTDAYGDV